MSRISRWRQKIEKRWLAVADTVCTGLAVLRVPPNAVSAAGLIGSVIAGGLYGSGRFFLGGIGVLLAGACDTIDGRLARRTGRASDFGAFFDSTLDRFGEIAIFSGLAFYFAAGDPGDGAGGRPAMVLLSVLALSGSLMVSYTRARAEGLSLKCDIGMMQRPERMFVLIVGSFATLLPVIGAVIMQLAIGALAVFGCYCALQRMYHVYRQLSRGKGPGGQ